MKSDQKWCMAFFTLAICSLTALGLFTMIIDPFFHYHKPLDSLEYPLKSERQRYLNDGILKNFDYNALLIGSSMTENFKASQFDNLFNVQSVKVCYSGTTYYEMKNNIQTALKNQPNLKMIVLGADLLRLYDKKDMMRYDLETYPTYLYDYNFFNDAEYLLNKEIILIDTLRVFAHTFSGQKTTSFDEYSNWGTDYIYSKESVDASYTRPCKIEINKNIMNFAASNAEDNITQNIVDIAKQNPDIQFYVFFPPYSLYFWDEMNQFGMLEWQFDNLLYATELMLTCENIHLFSFFDQYDITCNLDNYKDFLHYSPKINDRIIESMSKNQCRLNKENYKQHFQNIRNFYSSYDYDALFQ